jgi:hypothetical protein
MKNSIVILLVYCLIIPPTFAANQSEDELTSNVCNKDELFSLMVEKGYIDLKDSKMCFNMNDFPSMKINMQEANYGLNGMRNKEGSKKQDNAVANMAKLFNEALPDGKKMHVSTRGYADGTRNISEERDEKIMQELFSGGGMTYKKLQDVMEEVDPNGFQNIATYLKSKNSAFGKGSSATISANEFNSDKRLSSMIRNYYLAQARGEDICTLIHNDPNKCDNEGEISGTLDKGVACFDGCCDGRRGAVVRIMLPQDKGSGKKPSGRWQPPFDSPSRDFQGKLQVAGSLSVFDLPVEIDPKVEAAVLSEDPDELTPALLAKDKEAFRKAMEGTGCAGNEFAIDHARRIFWEAKIRLDSVDPKLKDAVLKNDFATVMKMYQKAGAKDNSHSLFKVLFSGAGANVIGKPPKGCGRMVKLDKGKKNLFKNTHKNFIGCKIVSDDPFFSEMKDVYSLLHSEKIEGDHMSLLAATTSNSRGRFFIFDKNTGKKHEFSYDYNQCKKQQLMRGSAPYRGRWGDGSRDKKRYDSECMRRVVHMTPKKVADSFFPDYKRENSVTPTDPLNCLNVSKAYDYELRDRAEGDAVDLSMQAEKMQKPFCKVARDGNLALFHDHNGMTNINNKKGFMCKACSSGVYVRPGSDKFEYNGRSNDSQKRDIQTWAESGSAAGGKELNLGSAKHLRSYLIPNCGPTCEDACACLRDGNIQNLIKQDGAEVFDFTDSPLGQDKKPKYQGDKKGGFACMFTPPVPHTCSYNPYGESLESAEEEEGEPPRCILKDVLAKKPSVRTKPSAREIETYKTNCGNSSFPMPENKCADASNNLCYAIKKQNGCLETNKSGGASSSGASSK